MKNLTIWSICFCLTALISGCEPEAPGSSHDHRKARSGGDYYLIEFTGMQAEVIHPSANPEGDQFFLKLPLPENEDQYLAAPLAVISIEDRGLSFSPFRADGNPPEHTFYYVVKDGEAVKNPNPKLEFRVALAKFGSDKWTLAIGRKQYSLRQLGQDLAEFGATEAVEIPLTDMQGWYRYADANFELRRTRKPVSGLLVFSAQ